VSIIYVVIEAAALTQHFRYPVVVLLLRIHRHTRFIDISQQQILSAFTVTTVLSYLLALQGHIFSDPLCHNISINERKYNSITIESCSESLSRYMNFWFGVLSLTAVLLLYCNSTVL
jgi:hypothetical protein